ncbi:hypothetical protein [Priestia aryabhattai]|uniref:hypothetical protein n=1 Tax=Priestia aryabhattai TaxID=412384 RepID=UPI001C8E685A|nr:hypothetical protein [Priestia aryabhattai]MBY0213882.1 hypothetical protein [Priestia aryabhattai]
MKEWYQQIYVGRIKNVKKIVDRMNSNLFYIPTATIFGAVIFYYHSHNRYFSFYHVPFQKGVNIGKGFLKRKFGG